MDFEIGGTSLPQSVEQAIDDALGTGSTDRILLTREAATALLSEFDAIRENSEPVRPRFLHVMTKDTEQLVRVEAISCVAVQPNGMATVAFAGGGIIQFDAMAWRLLFGHIKQYVDLELVPVAPASKLGN